MSVTSPCYGLFVDLNDVLYCSQRNLHQVVMYDARKWLSPGMIIAGTGCNGSSAVALNAPYGIFVTTSRNLYVADCRNNRVQLFTDGKRNAQTVVMNSGSGFLFVQCPTGIVLDADEYVFIVSQDNHRVIGFRCIVGCIGLAGATHTQLNSPQTISFDSHGNLYVLDQYNSRIQKFTLLSDNYGKRLNLRYTIDFSRRRNQHWSDDYSSPKFLHKFLPARTVLQYQQQALPCAPPASQQHFMPWCSSQLPMRVLAQLYRWSVSNRSSAVFVQHLFQQRYCLVTHSLSVISGTCVTMSNNTYACSCTSDWQGVRCEQRRDYYANITCENRGVCRSLSSDYQCTCLPESFSGSRCEVKAKKTIVLQAFAASVSIVVIVAFASFIVVMDLLKYVLNINPGKRMKPKRSRPRQIVRFIYVNQDETHWRTLSKASRDRTL